MSIISPSPFSSSPNETITATRSNSWGPYASAGDFKGNALIIISILFCAVLLFLAFNSIIRFLLCASCPSSSNSNSNDDEESQNKEKMAAMKDEISPTTTMVFSKDMKLAGAAAECAICLSDFLEGDGIRVLPACNHGFHVKCVEKWLALRCSCPTCRRSALLCDDSTSSNTTRGSIEDV